jgi:hypothetical protein
VKLHFHVTSCRCSKWKIRSASIISKQGYSVRKAEKDKLHISAGMKLRNKQKFWYGIPAYICPF